MTAERQILVDEGVLICLVDAAMGHTSMLESRHLTREEILYSLGVGDTHTSRTLFEIDEHVENCTQCSVELDLYLECVGPSSPKKGEESAPLACIAMPFMAVDASFSAESDFRRIGSAFYSAQGSSFERVDPLSYFYFSDLDAYPGKNTAAAKRPLYTGDSKKPNPFVTRKRKAADEAMKRILRLLIINSPARGPPRK